AMQELVKGNYVTAIKYNQYGRMKYTKTPKCDGEKLSFADMERFGRWSATRPAPTNSGAG
ncbi:hypothetical protein, partial [Escherichia coli]